MLTPSTEDGEIPNTEINLDLQIHKLYTKKFQPAESFDEVAICQPALNEKKNDASLSRHLTGQHQLAASLFTLATA